MLSTLRSRIAAVVLLVAAATAILILRHTDHPKPAAEQEYVDSATCLQCHAGEAAGYARTGMAHAFSKPKAENTVGSRAGVVQFYHAASETFYSMTEHDGKFYQRRWQTGFEGRPENIQESTIDYVMGSGNHVRTYLHREPDGVLVELPLAWYSEERGHWGMNPGFDNPHPMTRRTIAYECMFCHNAYPQVPPVAHRDLSANPTYGSELPEGIDCERCHGPGAAHVKAVRSPGASLEEVRAKILNPKHLSNERQMEVCEQCHLETTSHLLPDRIRHYDQEPFGYMAGQLLASFNAYFVKDPAKAGNDNFEIVSAPYRLRQSQCYLKSQGSLTCEMCHNPHDLHKGPATAEYYANVCMGCHAAGLSTKIAAHQHTASNACVSCHMPQRRTEDVVHVVMTDHLIQRRPTAAKDLLAKRQETPDIPANAYRGKVVRYRLDGESAAPSDALYDAAAQVIDSSNLEAGVPLLAELVRTKHPSQPNFSIELGDALRHTGDLRGAIDSYRQAVQLDPLSSRAQRRLGVALGSAGQTAEALAVLHTATDREPGNALLWYEQALIESKSGGVDKAIADLRQALALQADFADAQDTLGSLLAQSGDRQRAEDAFRAALAINPYDSESRANLGRVLASNGDWAQAAFQLQKAVQLDRGNASAHGDLAVALLQLKRLPEAEAEARAAVTTNAKSAQAHDFLGEMLAQKGETAQARREFEAALSMDAEFGPAQLDLAEILIQQGQAERSIGLLEKAERSPVSGIRERSQELLQQLRRP